MSLKIINTLKLIFIIKKKGIFFMKSIQVSDEVHRILTKMGSKKQSYNDIIYSLIEKNRSWKNSVKKKLNIIMNV